MKRTGFIIFWVVAFTVLLSSSVALMPTTITVVDEVVKDTAHDAFARTSFVPHDQVIVSDNSDFSTEGFTGSGTSNDPYVLEGVFINSTICVSILGVTAYYEIRNSLLISTGLAISLNGAPNGVVESCEIVSVYAGVQVESGSHNGSVVNNTISQGSYGVNINNSNNITVANNSISD
ncbi:MAG: right-handed parallel beta-helix repeat-containing protein, partial [Candidatus Thorarchaeota archaeon]